MRAETQPVPGPPVFSVFLLARFERIEVCASPARSLGDHLAQPNEQRGCGARKIHTKLCCQAHWNALYLGNRLIARKLSMRTSLRPGRSEGKEDAAAVILTLACE